MIPWFFVILVALCRCLCIWRSSPLFQTLWADFSKGRLLPAGGGTLECWIKGWHRVQGENLYNLQGDCGEICWTAGHCGPWLLLLYGFSSLFLGAAAPAAKSLQSCPTLCDPIDGSPLRSTIPGILQARTLEWVAISFSNAWKWKGKVKSLSRVRPSVTPWTAAFQAPPSMGFSRQE